MKKKQNNSFIKSSLIILVILVVIGCSLPSLLNNLKFGLDLQGGFEVLYEVKSIDGKKLTDEMVQSTYKTIQKRIDVLGVSEPEIVIEGNNKIRVQLAGVTDPTKARQTLSSVANLTFRDSNDKLLMNSDVLKSGGARLSSDNRGRPAVGLSIANKDKFYQVTTEISQREDKTIVIWLDYDGTTSYKTEGAKCGTTGSACLSAANVSQGFADDVIIQGNFKQEEVEELVNLINSGSLPTKLSEISSRTVSASFGENSLELTAKAGLIGVSLIALLMIFVFRFAGLIASIGVLIYTFLTFLTFWLFGGVLTLPGIAALVIGIGMAIDACVISFSRIRDELKDNVRLEGAIKKGNKNSFMAILDANITTLLVAVILFIFGESSVKGFATMLIISTIVTMLIMVGLTRFLINLFGSNPYFADKLNLFIGYNKKTKEPKFNYVKIKKFCYIYLGVMVVVGAISLATNKLTLGIDFKGGSSISLVTDKKISESNVAADLKAKGYNVYSKETAELNNKNHVIIKVSESFNKTEVLEIEAMMEEKYDALTEIGVISNQVKKDLVKNAFMSVIIAIIGIIAYVSIRFRFSYAISAIVALLHDALAIIIIFSLFKIEVTAIFIAAILSIIGYSINDTIVTFDRVRENIMRRGKIKTEEDLENIVNTSINATLGRSIVSTVTTLIPVVCLIMFGATEVINFNIALFIGLIFGVLSSIFIAAQIWFDIEKKQIGKPIKKKWYEEEDVKMKKAK